VIAIIALLIGILLPAIGKARDTARGIICQTNIRQVATANLLYAADYRGNFAPVIGGPDVIDPENNKRNMVWYDVNRIGQYLPESSFRNVAFNNVNNQTVGGGVMQCPNHPDGARSYTLNYWASSAGEYFRDPDRPGFIKTLRPGQERGEPTFGLGNPFKDDSSRSSELILLAEAWAPFKSENPLDGVDTTWFSQASMGGRELPGRRFGGGIGLPANIFVGGSGISNWASIPTSPELGSDRTVMPTSYLPYYRHPRRNDDLKAVGGNANIAFLDGHVSNFSARDLFEEVDGSTNTARSTYKALWSLKDFELERDLRD
jgi:prepilin-type processing-associated H-X9-DG protein